MVWDRIPSTFLETVRSKSKAQSFKSTCLQNQLDHSKVLCCPVLFGFTISPGCCNILFRVAQGNHSFFINHFKLQFICTQLPLWASWVVGYSRLLWRWFGQIIIWFYFRRSTLWPNGLALRKVPALCILIHKLSPPCLAKTMFGTFGGSQTFQSCLDLYGIPG